MMIIPVRPTRLRAASACAVLLGVLCIAIGLAGLGDAIAYVVMFAGVGITSAGVLLTVRSGRSAILLDDARIGVRSPVSESWIPLAEIVLVTTARTSTAKGGIEEMLVLWRAGGGTGVRGAFAQAGIDQRDATRLAEAQSKLGKLSPFIISISGVDATGRQQILDAVDTLR